MNSKIYRGFRGEALVRRYLVDKGYKIIATNYRSAAGEADLVATDDKVLVFVEIKSRAVRSESVPSSSVTHAKQRRIVMAASSFIKRYQAYGVPIRFDIAELFGAEINYIENAFSAKW